MSDIEEKNLKQPEYSASNIQVLEGLEAVITSYSIHYTKLYEYKTVVG